MAEIGGMNIRALAAKYGTPLYVYDEGRICDILNSYREHFQSDTFESGVLYASKAFSCKAIVTLIAEYGMYLDVVSGGEIYTAKQAGYDMSKIFFHGNNKTPEEITFALQEHVGTFVVDNLQEAELLKELSENADYTVHALLRVNPGVEAHTHNYIVTAHVDSKFGISFLNEEEIVKTIEVLKTCPHIAFDGFHAHIGSQIFDRNAFGEEIRKLFEYAKHMKDTYGTDIKTINIGGGFAARYTASDAPIPTDEVCRFILDTCREENEKNGLNVHRILIEPGRSIVAEAGYTIYTAGGIKTTPNRHYVFVDGGMSDNIRPALYQAEYDAVVDGKENEPANTEYTVAGKCCESGDILIQKISLPDMQRGDLIVLKTTGAYGYSMASHYNKLPLPAVVFVKDGTDRLVIRRETFEHMTALEV